MKNMVKKNQIMITALAIMIGVAGYLNFAGGTIAKEELVTTTSGTVAQGEELAEDVDVASMFEISDEDMQQSAYGDIESLDSDIIMEGVEAGIEDGIEETLSTDDSTMTDTPGEAVFTSTTGVEALSGAKLLKEQTRAKNKETLLEIINSVNISEEQKQTAIDGMIHLTDIAEKETAAEILLEAKGFDDVVVSITDTGVDVVVNAAELTEADRAQIEDIIVRKTGIAAESIVISTVTED